MKAVVYPKASENGFPVLNRAVKGVFCSNKGLLRPSGKAQSEHIELCGCRKCGALPHYISLK
jgi:hypothetical protein